MCNMDVINWSYNKSDSNFISIVLWKCMKDNIIFERQLIKEIKKFTVCSCNCRVHEVDHHCICCQAEKEYWDSYDQNLSDN
jgi:hypothetical protein